MRLRSLNLVFLSAVPCSFATSQTYFGNDFSFQRTESHIRNATDNLIFTSIASLLQQWPNTRYRNGHTIVQGTIPAGTVLYHARGDKNIPSVPEWTGFNVEHSYLLCPPPECWMLTLSVEKPLKVVYFDGSSAANSVMGHQDSQDVVLWGRVRPDKVMAEWERLEELCRWGRQFNLDGFVRMEPGFEAMLCDFTKNTKLVSSIHIMAAAPRSAEFRENSPDILRERQQLRQSSDEPPKKPEPPRRRRPEQPLPPNWEGPLRDHRSTGLAAIQTAAWNSFYPGEVRTKLDYSRLISFYDPVYTSLLAPREGAARNRHRLVNISMEDVQLSMEHLRSDLSREDDHSSDIDWSATMRAVTDRYADRLLLMKDALDVKKVQDTNATTVASTVRRHLMVMLMPYLLYGVLPTGVPDNRNTSWVEPMAFYCETSLTSAIAPEGLYRSERLIKGAIEGVLHRICSLLTGMWVGAFGVTTASEQRASELVEIWRNDLESLMQWLDWPMWDVCRPACPEEMFCYIPTWPWGISWTEDDADSVDMTPKCIDRETGDLGLPQSHPH